jgi:hypothetical protein
LRSRRHCGAGGVGRRRVGPCYPSALDAVRGSRGGSEFTATIAWVIDAAVLAVPPVVTVIVVAAVVVPWIGFALRYSVDRPTNGTRGRHCT